MRFGTWVFPFAGKAVELRGSGQVLTGVKLVTGPEF